MLAAVVPADGARQFGTLFDAEAAVVAYPDETCGVISNRLAVHGLERLPVLARNAAGSLVGLVSRSDLVKLSVRVAAEEEHREVLRSLPGKTTKSGGSHAGTEFGTSDVDKSMHRT